MNNADFFAAMRKPVVPTTREKTPVCGRCHKIVIKSQAAAITHKGVTTWYCDDNSDDCCYIEHTWMTKIQSLYIPETPNNVVSPRQARFQDKLYAPDAKWPIPSKGKKNG